MRRITAEHVFMTAMVVVGAFCGYLGLESQLERDRDIVAARGLDADDPHRAELIAEARAADERMGDRNDDTLVYFALAGLAMPARQKNRNGTY